jgi:hypothetical protein
MLWKYTRQIRMITDDERRGFLSESHAMRSRICTEDKNRVLLDDCCQKLDRQLPETRNPA